MALYLTEQVADGEIYNNIVDIHNRVIKANNLLTFLYASIKTNTDTLINHYGLTPADWGTLPNTIQKINLVADGDVENYWNELASNINNTIDMLQIALSYWTDFFKKEVEFNYDATLASLFTDNDVHNKPQLNLQKITKSWVTGDVDYASDFNTFKSHLNTLLDICRRVDGAYRNLCELNNLSYYTDTNFTITRVSGSFSTLESQPTQVEPTPPTDFTIIKTWYGMLNKKYVLMENTSGTQHIVGIWDYEKQDWEFKSDPYPKQDYPTLDTSDYPDYYLYLTNHISPRNHVMIDATNNVVYYVTYSLVSYESSSNYKYLVLTIKTNEYNLIDGMTVQNKYNQIFSSSDDLPLSNIPFNDTLNYGIFLIFTYHNDRYGRYTIIVDTFTPTNKFVNNYSDSMDSYTVRYTSTGYSYDRFKSYRITYDEGYNELERVFLFNENGASLVVSNNASGGFLAEYLQLQYNNTLYENENEDDERLEVSSSTGISYISPSSFDDGAVASGGYRIFYGLPIVYGRSYDSANNYYFHLIRSDTKSHVDYYNTEPYNTGFTKTDNFHTLKDLNDSYTDNVIIYYQPSKNNSAGFVYTEQQTLSGIASDNGAIVQPAFFIPDGWYADIKVGSQDSFVDNDGTHDVKLFYYGKPSDKLLTYDYYIIQGV